MGMIGRALSQAWRVLRLRDGRQPTAAGTAVVNFELPDGQAPVKERPTYRDLLIIKRMLLSDKNWTEICGMKRPRSFEFWKKKEWERRTAQVKRDLRRVLKENYCETDEPTG